MTVPHQTRRSTRRSSHPRVAACLVLGGETTPPALAEDLARLVDVADEVVVYDTADHVRPGSAAFASTLHPAVTVVAGPWSGERAHEAALSHVGADWALCVLPGERVTAAADELRSVLAAATDAVALAVRVDDVVRGTHRSARLLHLGVDGPGAVADVEAVPSHVLTVRQPVQTTARLPQQRGVFARV